MHDEAWGVNLLLHVPRFSKFYFKSSCMLIFVAMEASFIDAFSIVKAYDNYLFMYICVCMYVLWNGGRGGGVEEGNSSF